jgi:hypothetical protein
MDVYCLGDALLEPLRTEAIRAPRLAYSSRESGASRIADESSFDKRFTGNAK